MIIRTHISTLFVLISAIYLMAQDVEVGVQLRAKSNGSAILLRWAPTSPIVWNYANQYGYTLEKITLMENGKMLTNQKVEVLGVIKPAPLHAWEASVEQNDYAAIAAQTIYGEDFSITETFSSEMVKVINQSRELENKFSFALFAADMSTEAARLSGLFFRDEQVYNDYQYLYRVYPNIPPELIRIDMATVLIGLDEVSELPVIKDFDVAFGDQVVELSWGSIWGGYYSGYWVEKSSDGNYFQAISKVPIVQTAEGEAPRIFVYDSLAGNEKQYQYRVVGVDFFGEKGPPSIVISGVGKPDFKYSPSIDQILETKWGTQVSWRIPDLAKPMIVSYDLMRQDPENKWEELIIPDIEGSQQMAIDSLPNTSNYYVIRANDKYGRSTKSFPYFFQLDDSIPPLPPKNFKGEIDTLGLVHLRWDSNTEKDLYGYKLYVSNFRDAEFIQVPGPIIRESQFIDTIHLATLTEEIFYQIKAFDSRFNPSVSSTTLELKKPDLIPPLPPVFTAIKADTVGIHLHWEDSPSEDVTEYFLYRRSEYEEDWTLIKSFHPQDSLNDFLDESVENQVTFGYAFIVLDDGGFESRPSEPVSIKFHSKPEQVFTKIFSFIDPVNQVVSLKWDYTHRNIKNFHIYKSRNGEASAFFKVVEGSKNEFQDQYNPSDEFVEYQLLATFEDGGRSGFSKKILVEF